MSAISPSNELTLADVAGVTKDVFGPKVLSVVPQQMKLQKQIGFNERAKIGQHYSVPVRLRRSHGFTYATGDAGAFTLNDPEPSVHKEAQITASEMVFRTFIPYKVASSVRKGPQAFFDASAQYITYGLEDSRFRLECSMLYGGTSLFEVNASSGSGTTRTWTISDASFCPGLISNLENAWVDVYDDADASNQQNTNDRIQITSIDLANKQIDVSGNSTDLSTIDTQIGTADVHIFFDSAGGTEFDGLSKLCSATGTTFNIDGSTYHLWQGNTHTVNASSQLTLQELMNALHEPGNKGAFGEKFESLVSHRTFTDLNNDAAALRVVDSSYAKDITQGHDSLKYCGSVGEVSVGVHPYMKEGEALVYVPSKFMRIGSTDISFGVPGAPDNFLSDLPDNAGYQVRLYSDQALFAEELKCNVKITGFTNGDN